MRLVVILLSALIDFFSRNTENNSQKEISKIPHFHITFCHDGQHSTFFE